MDQTTKALLEGRAIVAVHIAIFTNLLNQWAGPAEIVAQLDTLNAAVKAFAALPRPQPQQKAA